MYILSISVHFLKGSFNVSYDCWLYMVADIFSKLVCSKLINN